MRILHVLDHSIPLQSGYTFRTRAILREQRSRGWETLQVTGSKHRGATAAVEEFDGFRFHRTLSRGRWVERVPIARQLAIAGNLARRVEEVARAERPDVLHAHSPCLNGLAALRVAKRLRLPVVYEVRAFWEDAAADLGTSPEGGLRYRATRALESYVLRRVDAVTCLCRGLADELEARGVARDRLTVVPNAVDVERFGAHRARDAELARALGLDGARVLGFLGSFYAYEGLMLLLDALPRIRERAPDARVLLVGGGPEEARLRARAAELGAAVVMVGRVPHDRVEAYYGLVDVLVYPRLSMRLTELVTPLKPLEAMAQRKLVVASDVGGHRELIRHAETGVLFRAGDAESLARAVLDLWADPVRADAMRSAAFRFVSEERTWHASVARYAPVYERIVHRA